jgi:ParB family chromosome partitioning protein
MNQPAPRLGRGLASLIPDSALDLGESRPERSQLRMVPLDEIRPNPEQPREVFQPAELESLADSLRQHGVLTPLVVRRSEGRYILIAGERRFRAAALAGLREVPVVVRDAPTPREQLELALVENLQRSDLDPIEAAKGYERLAREFHLTHDDVARRVGKDRATITNAVRLLRLPEFVLAAVRDGRLSAGHARALVPLADTNDDLRQVVSKVLGQQLSVRATEKLVGGIASTPRPVRTAERERKERTYEQVARLLTDSLQTAVTLKTKDDGSGQIVIAYGDHEELDRLVQRLRARA